MEAVERHTQSLEALAARGLPRAPLVADPAIRGHQNGSGAGLTARRTFAGYGGWLSFAPYHVPVRSDNREPAIGSRGVEIPLLTFNKAENATPFPTN